ncbi:MAG TPA: class I SAM-dependent methyltransferase [Pseudonocardiaceae bacterium]|nr:class I SAM-dependent methyltransferase [Pseudonocardiaceae bacterium]
MTDTLDTVRAAYDEAADRYNAFVKAATENPLDHALIDAFLELAGDTGSIADLGCGPGHYTAYFASRGRDALGIDLSPEMIQLAKAAHPGLRFSVGSMTRLDLADGEMAAIMSWYSTIHTPPAELPVILRELNRVLAPGGYLLLGFFSTADVDGEPREFDHRITPGFRWPAGRLSRLLGEAGFVEAARMTREPVGAERFQRGCLIATKPAG